jgi:hypothetical protein
VSDETTPKHHHTLRERLDAAEVAADEVVAEESGQLGSEVGALAVPFEEIAAAVRAAIHPDGAAEDAVVDDEKTDSALGEQRAHVVPDVDVSVDGAGIPEEPGEQGELGA